MTRTFVVAVLSALMVPGLSAAAPSPDKRTLDPKVRELRLEQVNALKEQLELQFERVKIGKDPLIVLVEAIRELGEAELELSETPEAQLAALEGMVKRFKDTESDMEQLQRIGLQSKVGVAQVRAARLKAEIQLEKWKKR